MRSKKLLATALLATGILSISLSPIAMAHDDDYQDRARVISVVPQIERVNVPRQECHTEYARESYNTNRTSPAGAIIGGIAGGLLGNTVGRGNGRIAATVVGAGLGAVVGNRIGNNQSNTTSYGTRPVDHCYAVDNWQTVNRGYLVTYRYNGRNYTTFMDHQPGDSIPVNVAIDEGYSRNVSQVQYIENDNSKFDNRPRDWNRGRDWRHDHDRQERHYW